MKALKICLTDDHKMFREGLRFLLEHSDIEAEIREASSGGECLSVLGDWQADLVFMDIEMPEMNGIECCREVLNTYPETKVIALSMYADDDYYSSMIEVGATGFILKNSGFDEVKKAIMQVVSGHHYFSPGILDAFVQKMVSPEKKKKQKDQVLSERETEVLFYICKGLSNAEIAGKLNISKRTVDKHRENILVKTGTNNTAGLVMYAVRAGIAEV